MKALLPKKTCAPRPRQVVVLTDASRAYGRGLLLGVAKFLREQRAWTVQTGERRRTETAAMWLKNWKVDGIIAWVEDAGFASVIRRLAVPAVEVRGSAIGCDLPLINLENQVVARRAAKHLCELPNPSLMSVVPDTVRIGYEASALLERLMAGETPPSEPILIPPLEIKLRASTDGPVMNDPRLVAGARFLREHLFDAITVNDLARAASMSRRVFERCFKARVGRAPKEEVVRLRLERVKILLSETDWTLKQIAAQTGFKHDEYLHTVFSQKFGVTPGQFRKEAKLSGGGRSFRAGETMGNGWSKLNAGRWDGYGRI
jgi:AraC-like DNA-binding protein